MPHSLQESCAMGLASISGMGSHRLKTSVTDTDPRQLWVPEVNMVLEHGGTQFTLLLL